MSRSLAPSECLEPPFWRRTGVRLVAFVRLSNVIALLSSVTGQPHIAADNPPLRPHACSMRAPLQLAAECGVVRCTLWRRCLSLPAVVVHRVASFAGFYVGRSSACCLLQTAALLFGGFSPGVLRSPPFGTCSFCRPQRACHCSLRALAGPRCRSPSERTLF